MQTRGWLGGQMTIKSDKPDYERNVVPADFRKKLYGERLSDDRSEPKARLKDGDGDGTSDDMEARVARLESDMTHVKDTMKSLDSRVETVRTDVGTLKVSVATITTELAHKPTTTQMWIAAIGIVGALSTVIALVARFLPHAP